MTQDLTRGRVLARSAAWNLAGHAAPILVALVAIPPLISGLGLDRFGVLSLAWTIVGYFGLFDLGLGWALTRVVAERTAAGRVEEVPELVWTSMALLLGLGVVGSLVLALLSSVLVHDVLRVSAELESETILAFQVIAAALPAVVCGAGLSGVLAAQQRFAWINAVRVPLAVFSYLGPLVVLSYSPTLVPVVSLIVASRYVGLLFFLVLCVRALPSLRRGIRVKPSLLPSLFRVGGWIAITNVVGPFMVNLDRFLVGALLTLASVTYYATPFELVSRIWLLSSPVVVVLFPAFAASYTTDRQRTARLFALGFRYAFSVLFPAALLIATLAPQGLELWLGAEFAGRSTRVLQILCVGAFINGLAHVALAVVQGAGNPAWAARVHMIELPLYFAVASWLIHVKGIEGAAIAWLARATVDAIVLFAMTSSILQLGKPLVWRAGLIVGVAVAVLVVGCVLDAPPIKGVFLLIVLGIHATLAWRFVVRPGRDAIASAFDRAAPR